MQYVTAVDTAKKNQHFHNLKWFHHFMRTRWLSQQNTPTLDTV